MTLLVVGVVVAAVVGGISLLMWRDRRQARAAYRALVWESCYQSLLDRGVNPADYHLRNGSLLVENGTVMPDGWVLNKRPKVDLGFPDRQGRMQP